MGQKISRRDFGRTAALGLSAVILPSALANQGEGKPAVVPTSDIAKVESQLGKPLEGEAKKLLEGAIRNNQNNGRNRMKHKLADISEPGFIMPVYPSTRRGL